MAASLMHVPPSCPGKVCEPCFSFQFRMWSKLCMVTILMHPRQGWCSPGVSLVNQENAPLWMTARPVAEVHTRDASRLTQARRTEMLPKVRAGAKLAAETLLHH